MWIQEPPVLHACAAADRHNPNTGVGIGSYLSGVKVTWCCCCLCRTAGLAKNLGGERTGDLVQDVSKCRWDDTVDCCCQDRHSAATHTTTRHSTAQQRAVQVVFEPHAGTCRLKGLD